MSICLLAVRVGNLALFCSAGVVAKSLRHLVPGARERVAPLKALVHCRKAASGISVCACAAAGAESQYDSLVDVNRLQTQLSKAVAAQDFTEAARIRDRLTDVCGDESTSRTGWTGLGVPDWLADRAERLGFVMPTEIQHKAVKLFLLGADVLLRAHTGSGKTLAFVMPVLSMLEYPPVVYVPALLTTFFPVAKQPKHVAQVVSYPAVATQTCQSHRAIAQCSWPTSSLTTQPHELKQSGKQPAQNLAPTRMPPPDSTAWALQSRRDAMHNRLVPALSTHRAEVRGRANLPCL